jgi:hypothetical protein
MQDIPDEEFGAIGSLFNSLQAQEQVVLINVPVSIEIQR